MKHRFARRRARIDRRFPHLGHSFERTAGQVVALACALAVLALVELPLASNPIAEATPPPPPSELIQQRTETSKTFDNHDGTYTRTLFSGPVHFRDGQRRWQPISSEIVDADEPGYAWRNEANSFQTLFKPAMADEFLRFLIDGRAFSLSLERAGSSSLQRRRFGVTYPDVFSGVDLRYDLLADRLKETLVLRDAQAPLHYRFLLTPPAGTSLRAQRLRDGSWAIVRSRRAAPVFVFAPPSLRETGAPLPSGDHVSMDISESSGQFAIDLAIEADWLRDPSRSFPIRLDPTIAIQPPVQDATVLPNWSTALPALTDRLPIGAGSGIGVPKYQAALQFDLGDIPAGANVTDAQLKLYFDGACVTVSGCGSTGHQLDLHRMTASWDPTKTTNGEFVFDATPATSFTLANGAQTQWMSWTITSLLQSWITSAQPNYGVLIKRSPEAIGASGPSAPSSRYAEATLGPKLEVTYTGDGVDLLPIESVHSNGAELKWTKWAPPSGASFEKYEIHRSPTARFTPSSSTLLATLRDVAMTSYTDTTAGPNRTFSYRIVANASVSNERRVTLPADGQASKVVQAEPGLARATYIAPSYDPCQSPGSENKLYVGAGVLPGQKYRTLLDFDLRTIPANAAVSSATLSLWHPDTITSATTVQARAVTADWEEGYASTLPGCGRGGGASWLETKPGIGWQTAGGDFEAANSATLTNPAGEQPGWDNYGLTGLVQRWVDIETPNHGVLLKAADEASGASFTYHSNDWTVSPTLRPKLTVSYADGGHALAPSVSVSEPAASAVVSGAAVRISAEAGDDRRVEQVEFLVDGQLVGTDTSSPYSVTWDSRTVANVTHALTAKATDDAGNVTTSAGLTVTVANSSPPTTSITSPLGGNVSGTVNVTANASDDHAVTKVEFYVDKQLRGTDAAAPYEFSWNTLDPERTAYDGAHTLHTKAYDAHTNVTTSSLVYVTTVNTQGTMYRGTLTPVRPPPDTVVYDPAAQNQRTYPVRVNVRNTSTVPWNNVALRYRWYSPDSPSVVTDSDSMALGSLAPDELTQVIPAVTPPLLPQGVNRAQYRLRFDLYDQTGQRWFAAQGNRPYERQVTVNKVLPVGLGIESYYRYDEESLGAGMRNLVNVANGNSIVQWTPFSAPGRGLSTSVRLTYNSLESASESPVGNNFSLAISSLTRFGLPLEVHPTEDDLLAGRTEKWIGFVDADGTGHRFEGRVAGDESVYWEEPAGQHLYLREFSTSDPERKWAFTTPDRRTYFYDSDGYPTYVQDGNENELEFTLEPVSGSSPVTKRVISVTDAGGRSFDITYYSDGDTGATPVVGRIKRITDHSGSALDFFYYDDGNLARIVQRGTAPPGSLAVPDRSFVFGYTTPDAQGPAIPGPLPPEPDPGTQQSTRLSAVRDPRGHATDFTYIAPTNPQNGWKLSSRQNRTEATTSFAYDSAAAETTVTAPLSRVTKYRYDSEGKVTSLTRPDNRIETMTWTSDRMLQKTFEPGGAYTERAYNANGQVTDEWDELRNHTLYEYENLPVDGNDVSGKWRAGRTIPHLSQLSAKTEPKGTATPGNPNDYRTQYAYNAQGNLTSETDPLGNLTSRTYRADGTLETTTDARQKTTTYQDIDPNGFATRVIDPLGQVSTSNYDDDGLLIWKQDPLHASYSGGNPREYRTYSAYDAFHRLSRQSSPKSASAEPGAIIWSSTDYDANDNAIATTAPFEGSHPGGARTTTIYDHMDRKALVTGPDRSVDPVGERTEYQYDAAGRTVRVTSPKGMLTASPYDFATFNEYDLMDRIAIETRYEINESGQITTTLRTYSCFNDVGNLVSVTEPQANIDPASFSCSMPNLPYTTRYTYDAAQQRRSETDPLGHSESMTYDANGNEETATDASGNTTTSEYDQNDQLTKTVEPFKANGERNLTTKLEYDAVGNVKREISPRAWDASSDKQTFNEFVKTYHYDDRGQLTRVDLPTSDAYPQAQYVHNSYDANGNLVSVSLPVTTSDPTAIPANKKTVLQYFDSGAIRTSKDPDYPRVHFDYTAQGAQAARIPESGDGQLDRTRTMLWSRDADGLVREIRDEAGAASTYAYDANDNIIGSVEAQGLTDSAVPALEIQNSFDGFDRLTTTRSRNAGEADYTVTEYWYDQNGNVEKQETNRIETPAGGLVTAGRIQDFVRNQADEVVAQIDHATPDPTDDQLITNEWSPTGLETRRERATGNAEQSLWQTRQVTTWDHYANGELKALTASNGKPPGSGEKIYETHDVSYEDANGHYVNGSRTSDTFQRPQGPAADCKDETCVATYTYDARDRLVTENDGHGTTSAFTLDPVGNLTAETVTQNGQPATRTFAYAGSKLESITSGPDIQQFFYDGNGNVDCATAGAQSSQADCSPPENGPVSTALLKDYAYDYKNRVITSESFNNGGSTGNSRYVYDSLDRPVEERRTPAGGSPRAHRVEFAGITSNVAREEERDPNNVLLATKTYSFDAFGNRTSLTNQVGAGSTIYLYGQDVHGSTSILVRTDGSDTVAASYGYRAYGAADPLLTIGDTGNAPLNPYRYTDKRFDPASSTYDMRARRFAAETTRFVQRDEFSLARADLELTRSALTRSRYGIAGGNPISYTETDGHVFIDDGAGGGGGDPNPPPPQPPPPGEPPPEEEEELPIEEEPPMEEWEYETEQFELLGGEGDESPQEPAPDPPPPGVVVIRGCQGAAFVHTNRYPDQPFGYAEAFGSALCRKTVKRVRIVIGLQTKRIFGPWTTIDRATDAGRRRAAAATAYWNCPAESRWRAMFTMRVKFRGSSRTFSKQAPSTVVAC